MWKAVGGPAGMTVTAEDLRRRSAERAAAAQAARANSFSQLVVQGRTQEAAAEVFRLHLRGLLIAYRLMDMDTSDETCERILAWLTASRGCHTAGALMPKAATHKRAMTVFNRVIAKG